MEMTLAEFLGWEENVEYRRGANTFKVDGNHLMDLRSNDYWGNTCCETWELIELRNAVRVKPKPKKYYLKHKYLRKEGTNYLGLNIGYNRLEVTYPDEGEFRKTKFTEEDIEKIESSGFDLCNIEKVEVEDE